MASNRVNKQIIQEGSGDCPVLGNMVELNYKAYKNDKTVFDESGEEPFKIILGDGRLIEPAIEEIQYMKKGEKSVFSCRAEYAFGEDRLPDGVAANQIVYFDVELLDFYEPEKPKNELPIEQRLENATQFKNSGNDLFKVGEYENALNNHYLEGIEYVQEGDDDDQLSQEEKDALKLIRIQLLSNAQMCCFKIGVWSQVIELGDQALQFDENNVKVLYRLSYAKLETGFAQEALDIARKAYKIDQGSRDIRVLMQKIQKILKEGREKEKKMYGNMFSKQEEEEKKEEDS